MVLLAENDSVYTNGSYVVTEEPLVDAPQFDNVYVTKLCVLGTVFFISVIGNTIVIVQIFRIRGSRTTIQSLILHLAIADLMVSFFNILMDIIWTATVEWLAGDVMCKIMKCLTVFGLHLSTYITVGIALDRCFAILSPMSRSKGPFRVRIMITTAWILSALLSIPQVSVNYLLSLIFHSLFSHSHLWNISEESDIFHIYVYQKRNRTFKTLLMRHFRWLATEICLEFWILKRKLQHTTLVVIRLHI